MKLLRSLLEAGPNDIELTELDSADEDVLSKTVETHKKRITFKGRVIDKILQMIANAGVRYRPKNTPYVTTTTHALWYLPSEQALYVTVKYPRSKSTDDDMFVTWVVNRDFALTQRASVPNDPDKINLMKVPLNYTDDYEDTK
jgi:hypothetical protein